MQITQMDNKALLARRLVAVSGRDGLSLLDKLVSQDLAHLGAAQPAAYTLLLTPQGKYLFDFFVFIAGGQLYLDTAASQTDALLATLNKYKLRSDASFAPRDDVQVRLGAVAQGDMAFADPRHPDLGWRSWTAEQGSTDSVYGQTLTRLGVVEPSLELTSGQAMPIEYGLQNHHAISFEKGCYMGQELTARMQHKDLAKRCVITLKANDNQALAGSFGMDVFDTQGATIGTLMRIASPYALVHVRRESMDAPVFELQRSDDGARIQLARN